MRNLIFMAVTLQVVFSSGSRDFRLSSSSRITALSSDVTIMANKATANAIIELYFENEGIPLAGQVVPRNNGNKKIKRAPLVFDCGYFSRLGKYKFVLQDSLLETNSASNVTVKVTKRPKIKLTTKAKHEASTTDVKVSISSPNNLCTSDVVSQYPTKVQFVRSKTVVVSTRDVAFPPTSVVFLCNVFDQPGEYMAQLVMSVRNNDVIIAKSDVMKVHWSGEYTLDVAADITNCPDGRIKVYYKRPPCVPPSDIIEVVAMGNNGNISLLTNHTLSGDEHFVQFECSSIFKDSQSAVICFRYMTLGVALRTVCRQTNHSVEYNVSGSWTTWSYWSQCQRPCSGTVSRRTRTCDNPKPMGKGKHCSKDSASNIDYEFEESDVSNSECEFGTPMTSTNTSSCTCGCFVEAYTSGVLSSPIAGQCGDSDEIIWTFYSLPSKFIEFEMVDNQLTTGELVTVTDQGRVSSITSQSSTVRTQANIATIRYKIQRGSRTDETCGFVLSYKLIDAASFQTTTILNNGNDTIKEETWIDDVVRNPVMAGGITACVVIIIIVVIVTTVTCCRLKQKNQSHAGMSMSNRLTTPPDGKSCSNIVETESDRPSPVGETTNCDTDTPVTPKPKAAYYLAQRQLQLMKKLGTQDSVQVYTSSCANDQNIRQQEALLFGHLSESETAT